MEYAKTQAFLKAIDIDISVFQHWCFQMAKEFLYIMELTQFFLMHSQEYEIPIPKGY